jgi:hypothetical protein
MWSHTLGLCVVLLSLGGAFQTYFAPTGFEASYGAFINCGALQNNFAEGLLGGYSLSSPIDFILFGKSVSPSNLALSSTVDPW